MVKTSELKKTTKPRLRRSRPGQRGRCPKRQKSEGIGQKEIPNLSTHPALVGVFTNKRPPRFRRSKDQRRQKEIQEIYSPLSFGDLSHMSEATSGGVGGGAEIQVRSQK